MPIDLQPYRVVSWDLDGTLYDSQRARRLAWLSFAAHPFAAYRDLRQLQQFHRAVELCRANGGSFSWSGPPSRAVLLGLEKLWYAPTLRRVGPRRGLVSVLERLARSGIRSVVFSDYETDYKLEALGLRHYFARSYAGEHLGWVKPSPKGLQRILEDEDILPNRLLHIGDRIETDEAAARAAGVSCLILGRDFSSFRELTLAP